MYSEIVAIGKLPIGQAGQSGWITAIDLGAHSPSGSHEGESSLASDLDMACIAAGHTRAGLL